MTSETLKRHAEIYRATLLDDAIDALGARDAGAAFDAADRVIQTGQDPRRFVEDLLERLRAGWNEMGLWADAATDGQNAPEVVMAEQELRYRLRNLERNCLWHLAGEDHSDAEELAPLWACLAA